MYLETVRHFESKDGLTSRTVALTVGQVQVQVLLMLLLAISSRSDGEAWSHVSQCHVQHCVAPCTC